MLKIGVTGGIGSGKSTICKIFELLNVPVYYSDDLAKSILNTDENIKQKVVELFGAIILDIDGLLNRKKIAEIVFNDSAQLEKLNNIIHPAVASDFCSWVALRKHDKYVLKEAAILFESGANEQVDKVIAVIAPKELRRRRVLTRDNANVEDINRRMENQMGDNELSEKSDFVIINDESKSVIQQVLNIHKSIIKLNLAI